MVDSRSIAALLFAAVALPGAARAVDADSAPEVLEAARKEGKLVLYSNTERPAATPLLKDFRALHPDLEVEYDEMNSTEVYNRFIGEAAGGAGPDLMWSSAMDLQLKLASDGHAQLYRSPQAKSLPEWAVWKDQAFGTTFEPIAFVYNRRLLKPEEVPDSHAALVKLIREHPDRVRGKIATYDVERSGLGFLLLTQDAKEDPAFKSTLSAYGEAGVKLYTSTGAMLERIQSGEQIFGFNMVGSYALAKQRKDPNFGIVYPRDYTLVVSRIAFIPKVAKHPAAAKVFLDYLLSRRGQEAIVSKASLFALRRDVQGETTAATLEKTMGKSLRPIPVDSSVLAALQPEKRLALLQTWRDSVAKR